MSLGYKGVVGFVRGRWVHWGASWGLSGSSMVAGFIGVRSGRSRVLPGSLGSLGCALWVVGFFRGDWVHCGSRWVSSGSSAVAGFIGVRCGGNRFRPGSLGSSGLSGVAGFIGVRPGGRRVHWDCWVH